MFTQFDLIWPWMTPDDLELTSKIFDINNWPHPPSFMSISQCLSHLTLDDPWWPWSELQIYGTNNWPHTPSFMSINQRLPHLTLDDPMTLQWHSKFSASIIDPVHQVSCQPTNVYPFDLIWPWMTLMTFQRPSQFLASTIDPTTEVSFQVIFFYFSWNLVILICKWSTFNFNYWFL